MTLLTHLEITRKQQVK